jgi:hypothetical protein
MPLQKSTGWVAKKMRLWGGELKHERTSRKVRADVLKRQGDRRPLLVGHGHLFFEIMRRQSHMRGYALWGMTLAQVTD